jgi:hypothetical protein
MREIMHRNAKNRKKNGYLLVTLLNNQRIFAIPTVLKTGEPKGSVGSNPTPSAIV